MFVIISHRKDLDGLASAAIALRYAALHRRLPFVLSLKDYADDDPVVEAKFLDLQNSTFCITDLSTNLPKIDGVLERLRALKPWNNEIYWFDHHPTQDRIRSSLGAVVTELDLRPSSTVASEIAYEDLFARNEVFDAHAKLLASLGRDADLLELKYDVTPKLMAVVDYFNYLDRGSIIFPRLQSLVMQLAFPRLEADQDGILEPYQSALLEEYEGLKTRDVIKIIGGTEVFDAGPYKVALFTYPATFSGTQASKVVMDRFKVHLSIGLSEQGEGSVRRSVDDVSCRKVAELFGGGGHDYAAGFPAGHSLMTPEELLRYKRKIKESVVQLLSRP